MISGQSQATTRQTGKYMKLLAFLAIMSKPGSGTVFDPTNVDLVVDIPLTTLALPERG